MKRALYLLKRFNPECWQVDAFVPGEDPTEWAFRDRMLGLSIDPSELSEDPSTFPVLRIGPNGNWAKPTTQIQPTDTQLIVLLQVKQGVDCRAFTDCTLEQAIALCETFDGAG